MWSKVAEIDPRGQQLSSDFIAEIPAAKEVLRIYSATLILKI